MTVISKVSKRNAAANNGNGGTTAPYGSKDREPSVYDNIWLNVGFYTPAPTEDDPKATKFVRLNRNVAVADLQTKTIYGNMDAGFKQEVTAMNAFVEEIRELGLELGAGESIRTPLEVQIYRKQDGVEVETSDEQRNNIKDLFKNA